MLAVDAIIVALDGVQPVVFAKRKTLRHNCSVLVFYYSHLVSLSESGGARSVGGGHPEVAALVQDGEPGRTRGGRAALGLAPGGAGGEGVPASLGVFQDPPVLL